MNQLRKSSLDTPSTTATVGTGIVKIAEITFDTELSEVGAYIKNLGPQPFSSFEVRALFNKGANAQEVTLASIAADYSTPLWPLRRVIGAPVTLALNAVATLFMNVQGIYILRFYAAAAAGAGTANVEIVAK